MWRYLKAAFLVDLPVTGLGRLPVNALAVFAVTALGFVEPSVWLAGIGIETALVASLAFNSRFQRLVDAKALPASIKDEAQKRSALVAALPQDLSTRLSILHRTAARVLEICRKLENDPIALTSTEASLDKLEWIYLKLLIARDHLVNDLGTGNPQALQTQIASLRAELAAPAENTALQRSQAATLTLLERRQQNLQNRTTLLKENESDLCRIETQVELMRENAAIEGKPTAVEAEIEFATDLSSTDLFGIHAPAVRDLEAAHSV